MELTILGNNGPYPAAGGACSGYLLCEGNKKLLFDCGNGVLSNLRKFIAFEELDAIILSHLHSDHMSDMMILRYAIQIKKNRSIIDRAFDVYAPDEPSDEFERLNINGIFNLKPISSNLVIDIGNLKLTFREMKHPVKSYAISAEAAGKRFVYSGDTSWNEDIIDFSRNSDMLLIDAGLLSCDKNSDNVPHLTAGECGLVAARAGVRRLLLTHLWPEYEISKLLSEAKENYPCAETANIYEKYLI